MIDKIVKTIAGIISIITSPLIIPTYGIAISLWCTYLSLAQASTRWGVLLFAFAITTMVPVIVIYILHRVGVVKHPSLNERTDRPFVYAAAVMAYLAMSYYLTCVHAPHWLLMFMLSAAFAALFTMVVNFKWKISGHATSIGGLVGLTFFLTLNSYTIHNNAWLFIATVIAAGAVMTSRLILERHTMGQVVAGFFSGLFWVLLFELVL